MATRTKTPAPKASQKAPEVEMTPEERAEHEAHLALRRDWEAQGVSFAIPGIPVRVREQVIEVLDEEALFSWDGEPSIRIRDTFPRNLFGDIDTSDPEAMKDRLAAVANFMSAAIQFGAQQGRQQGREDIRSILRGLIGVEASDRLTK